MRRIAVMLALGLFAAPLCAQDLAAFEKNVTLHKLDNGLTVIIVRRPEAPVFSYATVVNAGNAQEVPGITGLAHMFEHMAFKGSTDLGTTNYQAEEIALQKVESAYSAYEVERTKTVGRDDQKVAALEKAWKDAIDEAQKYVVPNEFSKIVDQAGAVGVNAFTQSDHTVYFYSFPSNRFELWAYLESERFLHPVFREFYKERDVVREERRMRIESSPQGQLIEALSDTAFAAHPYKNSPAGWASDIESLRATDAEAFYKRYYGPSNLTIGIAGDVNPAEAKKLAEKYFGRIPARPAPPLVDTVEPVQHGEKRVMVASPAQPFLVIAYKRPDQYSKDNAALDVLEQILSGGRTSIIYKDMVRDKKIALGAESDATYPGGKYPSLFLFFVVPNSGHTVEETEKAVYEIVGRVKKEKPDAAALQRVKINLRAALIQKLDSNSGLAAELCAYQAGYGDWRKLFTELDDYNKVTAEDVQRVAQTYLLDSTRTVVYTYAPAKEETK